MIFLISDDEHMVREESFNEATKLYPTLTLKELVVKYYQLYLQSNKERDFVAEQAVQSLVSAIGHAKNQLESIQEECLKLRGDPKV